MAAGEVLELRPGHPEVHEDVVRVRVGAVELEHERTHEPVGLGAGLELGAPAGDAVGAAVEELLRVAVEAAAVAGHDGGADADDGEWVARAQALNHGGHLLEVHRRGPALEERLRGARGGDGIKTAGASEVGRAAHGRGGRKQG